MYRLNTLFTKYSKSVPLVASIPAIIAGNDWYEYIRHNNTTKSHTNSSSKPLTSIRSARLLDRQSARHMSDVYHKSVQSVVKIVTDNGLRGTGFVAHKSGLIVTNAHVVRDWPHVDIHLQTRIARAALFEGDPSQESISRLRGQVVYVQPDMDLAIVRVFIRRSALRALTLSDSTDIKPGEPVLAVGHPGINWSSVAGVAVGSDRLDTNSYLSADQSEPEYEVVGRHVEHLAPVASGYSGGPVLDSEGRVVGVNFADTKTSRLAILSTDATVVLNKAIEFEKKTIGQRFSMAGKRSLGVVLEHRADGFVVTNLTIHRSLNISENDLKSNDIIKTINGKLLTTFTQLDKTLQSLSDDQQLEIGVYREGKVRNLKVKPLFGDYPNCSQV